MNGQKALELASKFGWRKSEKMILKIPLWERVIHTEIVDSRLENTLCFQYSSIETLIDITLTHNLVCKYKKDYAELIEISSHIAYKDVSIPYSSMEEFKIKLFELLYNIFVEKK